MKNLEDSLRKHGLKATPGRLTLLSVLEKSRYPLSISKIIEEMGGSMNQTTVYRALEALADSNIIHRVDLGHAHVHYEFINEKDHHHHIICKSCGKIEDVRVCTPKELEHSVLKKSKSFDSIKNHALEFFGVCNACVKS